MQLKRKTKYGVKLFEVYPKTIQAQELNTDSGLQKISIDFAYRYKGIGREPSKNLNDYIASNFGSNKNELFDVKGILTDILGKSGGTIGSSWWSCGRFIIRIGVKYYGFT